MGNKIMEISSSNKDIVKTIVHLLSAGNTRDYFSETRGTVFFGLDTPREEVLRTLAMIPEKGSILGVARVTGHDKDTISKWLEIAGTHCEEVTKYFLQDLNLKRVEVDEIWEFIKKQVLRYSLWIRRFSIQDHIGFYEDIMSISIQNNEEPKFNLTIRASLARFIRKGMNFSKKMRMHTKALDLFKAWYNFVKPHDSLKIKINCGDKRWGYRTPAMAEKFTDHIWNLGELLGFIVPVK
jgi:hypothetical protein